MERELPDGWIRASESDREATQRELATELLPTDLLAGIVLRVIAAWDSDDSVLTEHFDSELLSVVHLTYTVSQERANHPTVEFTGTYEEFLTWSGVQPEF